MCVENCDREAEFSQAGQSQVVLCDFYFFFLLQVFKLNTTILPPSFKRKKKRIWSIIILSKLLLHLSGINRFMKMFLVGKSFRAATATQSQSSLINRCLYINIYIYIYLLVLGCWGSLPSMTCPSSMKAQ